MKRNRRLREDFLSSCLKDRDHCWVLYAAFHGNRVVTLAHGICAAGHAYLVLTTNLLFDHRWSREETDTVLAEARWSYYDVAAGTGQDAGKENNLTAGFNWYWNPNMRMMMDWTHGWTQYNVGDENELDIIGLRMQVDF